MDLARRLYLLGLALGMLAIAAWGLVSPAHMLGSIGLQLVGPGAGIEGRAMYGGYQAGIALPLLVGAWRPDWRGPALFFGASTAMGIGLGRVVGILAAHELPPVFLGLAAFELLSGLIGLGLWAGGRR